MLPFVPRYSRVLDFDSAIQASIFGVNRLIECCGIGAILLSQYRIKVLAESFCIPSTGDKSLVST